MKTLAAVVEALVRMDPAEAVTAADLAESLRDAAPEELKLHEPELRRAAVLAAAAACHWKQMSTLTALNASGYSAEGMPVSQGLAQRAGGCCG